VGSEEEAYIVSTSQVRLMTTERQALLQGLTPSLVPPVSEERQLSRSKPTTTTTDLDCFPPRSLDGYV